MFNSSFNENREWKISANKSSAFSVTLPHQLYKPWAWTKKNNFLCLCLDLVNLSIPENSFCIFGLERDLLKSFPPQYPHISSELKILVSLPTSIQQNAHVKSSQKFTATFYALFKKISDHWTKWSRVELIYCCYFWLLLKCMISKLSDASSSSLTNGPGKILQLTAQKLNSKYLTIEIAWIWWKATYHQWILLSW